MNKMLVAIFDSETAADAGLQALHKLHNEGDITLYATGVLIKDMNGQTQSKKIIDEGPIGTAVGLTVGSLIGLLGGPVGLVVGSVAGTFAGAVRDLWVAGVNLDFVEEVKRSLQPGKVGLVAEIEEEWVTPLDVALASAGGYVFRSTRSEVAEAQFDHDIMVFKSEIKELEAEASNATGEAKIKLQKKLTDAKDSLDKAMHRATQRIDTLKFEAKSKTELLEAQLSQAKNEVKVKVKERLKRVDVDYHARGAKLSQAWGLTKEALTP